jgi:hypothetical protein
MRLSYLPYFTFGFLPLTHSFVVTEELPDFEPRFSASNARVQGSTYDVNSAQIKRDSFLDNLVANMSIHDLGAKLLSPVYPLISSYFS